VRSRLAISLPRHLAAFEHALSLQDTALVEGDLLKSPPLTPHDAPEWTNGVEKLTATSDFAVRT
jgi:hypothetical protein